jgi:hypothetical protein
MTMRIAENETLGSFGQMVNQDVRVKDDDSTIIPPDRYPEVFENIRVWGGPLMASVVVRAMKRSERGWTALQLKNRLIGEGLLADQAQAIIDQVMIPVQGPWFMDGLQGTAQQRFPAPEQYVPADILFRNAKWDMNEGWGQHIPQWARDMRGVGQDVMIDPGQGGSAVTVATETAPPPTAASLEALFQNIKMDITERVKLGIISSKQGADFTQAAETVWTQYLIRSITAYQARDMLLSIQRGAQTAVQNQVVHAGFDWKTTLIVSGILAAGFLVIPRLMK